ncbi:hypothetical protein BH23GEM6_BH23GEM6_13010 [soil metagenome]
MTLFAERLRDGRVALGTRSQLPDGEWEAGELHILEPAAYLDLSAWLAPLVHDAWIGTVRDRRSEPLGTAQELYGDEPGGVERLAERILREIPPGLLARAMILLANSIGPRSRARLIDRLNRTEDVSEDAELRRRLAEEHEAFAYAVAAAALFDALDDQE